MAWNDFLKSAQFQGGAPGILNYGIDTLANKFNNYAGSNRRQNYNQSLTDWGSPMGDVPSAPGATNIQYPGGNPIYPNQVYQDRIMRMASGVEPDLDRGNIDNRGFNFPSIFGTVKGGLEWLGDKFKRPDAKQRAYESIMGDRKGLGVGEVATGTYGGTGYDLRQTPSGLKVYSEVNPFGKNFDSAFGSQSLEEMDEKTLAWAQERLRTGKGLSKRLRNILENRGRLTTTGINQPGRDNIPVGPISTGTTGGATVTTGGGGTFNPDMDPRGRRDPTPSWRGATAAREQTFRDTGGQQGQVAGPGFGRGAYWAQGGRVGYRNGEFVEDINVEGPGFDENVMMASDESNDRILESLYEEHYDRLKGLGHDDEAIHEIIMGMFEDMSAQVPNNEQGLAGLV